jgi:two-component system sensor histidine kinase BaeS
MEVEDLFCATAIGNGRLRLHPQRVALDEVIDEVANAVLPLLRSKRQRLAVRGARSNATVLVDPRRIGQALINLIWNASNGAADDVPIEIVASATDLAARVEISAGGTHTPDPLSRSMVLAPRSPELNGSLGVDVARLLVQAHGGTLAGTHGDDVRYWFELPRS